MTPVKVYLGFKIELDDDAMFCVNLERVKDDYYSSTKFSSIREAEQAIDKKLKQEAIMKARERKTSISAYTEHGERVTITGVHSRLGRITHSPKGKSDNPDLYPLVEWVADAIREKLQLEKRIERIKEALYLVEIKEPEGPGYRRQFDVTAATEELLKEYDAKTALANKLNDLPAALAEVKRREAVEKKKNNRRFNY